VLSSRIPFSSEAKWSAIDAADHGVWILGAPEVILSAGHEDLLERVTERSGTGSRVLLVAKADRIDGGGLPVGARPAGLIELAEQIRPDASETIEWFREQGVGLRVLSGDHPATVATVASRVGIGGAEGVDARGLDVADLDAALDRQEVFGRVQPAQKKTIVETLQRGGHVVAMTGDGVNDVLALKQADLGIAMGSGSPATRAVGRLVLVDNEFARLPGVVAEGRRVIANIERVANLFLTKTVYVTLLAVSVGVLRMPFPFYPRHLTLISTLTIGVPAFFLALAPNTTRALSGFVPRVLRFAVPAGVIAATATFVGYAQATAYPGVTLTEARTVATLILFMVGIWVLTVLTRPYTLLRRLLVGSLIGVFAVVFTVPQLQELFALQLPEPEVLLRGGLIGVVACAAIELAWRLVGRLTARPGNGESAEQRT
jgi:cation-transporting ATPase E